MKLSFIRSIVFLTLAILLTIAATACGSSRSSLPEDLPPGTYLPDPIFEKFYEENGGFDFFGYAISTIFSDETGHKYQYFETVLMVYDPIREWISFEDLGSQLGLRNLPVPAWSGESLEQGFLVAGFTIHPAFVPMYLQLGPELVGDPITEPYFNLSRNHVEQHFQNLGLYFFIEDPEKTVGLLEYGWLDCGGCRPQYYLGDRAGIIQAPLKDASFYPLMEEKQISGSLVGEVVRGPARVEDGTMDLVFKHLVLFKDQNGELKIRPVPVMLGLQDEFLYSPLLINGIVFYEYQDGVGHNVLALFDDFVRTVPEGIYLTMIKQEGKQLTIDGVAESNGRVSAYMRNIDASDWMDTPKLKVIETRKGTLRSNDFTLTTSQLLPDDNKANNNGEGS